MFVCDAMRCDHDDVDELALCKESILLKSGLVSLGCSSGFLILLQRSLFEVELVTLYFIKLFFSLRIRTKFKFNNETELLLLT